jgi:AcrR family transcriptional regulator
MASRPGVRVRGLKQARGVPKRGTAYETFRLGRRPGDSVTREKILDAAEEAFAAGGYAGTSLREIAARAAVNPALVQYYFRSKDGLFTAIFLRRGQELVRERLELLDALERRPGPPPSVEEIVRAFLAPAFNLKRRGAGGIAFLRLQARMQNEPPELTQELRTFVYEESVQRCIKALRRALPDVDPKTIFWRITFVVGAYFQTVSDTNRLEIISGGRSSPKNLDEALRQLVKFCVAGLVAPSPD